MSAKLQLDSEDFARAAAALGVRPAVVHAVAEVEAPKGAFLPGTALPQPTVLFERHYFHKLTGGRFGGLKAPDVENDLIELGKSTDTAIVSAATPGGYGLLRHQHPKLAYAAELSRSVSGNHDAAMKSASWGMFQLMGLYHAEAGHPTLQGFVNAMYRGADRHLDAFVALIRARGLDVVLRNRDYEEFFRRYNGNGWRKFHYDDKFFAALAKWDKEYAT